MSDNLPEDVARGKDGWLFLVGGSNQVLDYFTNATAFPASNVNEWVALLRARADRCRAMGAQYLHMFAPEKLSVYFDQYLGELPLRSQTPIVSVAKAARAAGQGDLIVDVMPLMLRQKDDHMLYLKTDTHWTFEGCLCALQTLCAQLGVSISPTITAGKRSSIELALDLGGKFTPPIKEELVVVSFLSSARRVAANAMVVFKERTKRENDGGLHVGSNVVFCNHRADAVKKSIVLFGDSFAEYRTHLLTGMLAETFREVHFVWSASIDWSYVQRVKPDILLTESAERFATQVPKDDFDLDRFVIRKLAPMMQEGA